MGQLESPGKKETSRDTLGQPENVKEASDRKLADLSKDVANLPEMEFRKKFEEDTKKLQAKLPEQADYNASHQGSLNVLSMSDSEYAEWLKKVELLMSDFLKKLGWDDISFNDLNFDSKIEHTVMNESDNDITLGSEALKAGDNKAYETACMDYAIKGLLWDFWRMRKDVIEERGVSNAS